MLNLMLVVLFPEEVRTVDFEVAQLPLRGILASLRRGCRFLRCHHRLRVLCGVDLGLHRHRRREGKLTCGVVRESDRSR